MQTVQIYSEMYDIFLDWWLQNDRLKCCKIKFKKFLQETSKCCKITLKYCNQLVVEKLNSFSFIRIRQSFFYSVPCFCTLPHAFQILLFSISFCTVRCKVHSLRMLNKEWKRKNCFVCSLVYRSWWMYQVVMERLMQICPPS